MKPSIALTRTKKGLTELRAAISHLGSIRPSEAMTPDEFIELCMVRSDLNVIIDRLDKLVKGGEK